MSHPRLFAAFLGLATALTSTAWAAGPLQLETAQPPLAGRLDRCPQATAWLPIAKPVCLHTGGRRFCTEATQRSLLSIPVEQCFRLKLGDEVLVQGGVINPESGGLMLIPVLVARTEQGQPVMELMSAWPSVEAGMPAWLPRLTRLTQGKPVVIEPVVPVR
jgi:hypothetical protein